MKRYQHWLLAGLSAILLFISFPNINVFPVAWVAMVPFFIALTRAPHWKSAFWIGYLTGFLFFAGLLPAIVLLYPYANIFTTMNRLSAPRRLYRCLFCRFRSTYEGCVSAIIKSLIPARCCVYLDSIGMGAELDANRISVGEYRLFAMEQSVRYTGCCCYRCPRYQFRNGVFLMLVSLPCYATASSGDRRSGLSSYR